MKRYYTSVKRYRIIATLLPVLFIGNGILFTFSSPESNGFLGDVSQYTNILWFVMGFFGLIQIYRVYTNKVYLEINEYNIVYNFIGKKVIYEYSDAESYLAKQHGKVKNIYYKSIETGKKKIIPLNIFEIDYEEFFELLSKYSGKDIYIKNYGEEQRKIN